MWFWHSSIWVFRWVSYRSFNLLPGFMKRNVLLIFHFDDFLFDLPFRATSHIRWMIAITIGTFCFVFTFMIIMSSLSTLCTFCFVLAVYYISFFFSLSCSSRGRTACPMKAALGRWRKKWSACWTCGIDITPGKDMRKRESFRRFLLPSICAGHYHIDKGINALIISLTGSTFASYGNSSYRGALTHWGKVTYICVTNLSLVHIMLVDAKPLSEPTVEYCQ